MHVCRVARAPYLSCIIGTILNNILCIYNLYNTRRYILFVRAPMRSCVCVCARAHAITKVFTKKYWELSFSMFSFSEINSHYITSEWDSTSYFKMHINAHTPCIVTNILCRGGGLSTSPSITGITFVWLGCTNISLDHDFIFQHFCIYST